MCIILYYINLSVLYSYVARPNIDKLTGNKCSENAPVPVPPHPRGANNEQLPFNRHLQIRRYNNYDDNNDNNIMCVACLSHLYRLPPPISLYCYIRMSVASVRMHCCIWLQEKQAQRFEYLHDISIIF